MVPVKNPREFFIVNELAEGEPYCVDLERIKKGKALSGDIELAREFARWLARVHAMKHECSGPVFTQYTAAPG